MATTTLPAQRESLAQCIAFVLDCATAEGLPPTRVKEIELAVEEVKVFALSEDGETFVVRAGREFEVVGRNVLNEMALATPAVVGDSLVLRTQRHLYRIARP